MQLADFRVAGNRARFPFLFIVSYGRSGSTLLQGMVNSVPGYCVRGENYNALFKTFKTYHELAQAKRKWGRRPTDPTHPWYGIEQASPAEFARQAVQLFFATCLRPPAGTRCVGFKEIRYTPQHMTDDEFNAYLDFIGQVFPGAGLIFNIRKPEDTAASGFWRKTPPERVRSILDQTLRRFTDYMDGRSNAMLFSYDELMADWRYAGRLFEFLDEEFDTVRIREILDRRHSLVGKGAKSAAAS